MSAPDELVQLVICPDGRDVELAQVLKQAGTVYRRWRKRTEANWTYYLFAQGGQEIEKKDEDVPSHFHVLFFHTGENDPDGIPADRVFEREFAFSTGSLPFKGPYGQREKAIAIRRFPPGNCPVKRHHLPELKDFVSGSRTELPAFCRRDEAAPILWAFAILCQAFTAAGIARGEIAADDSLATAIGWDRLHADPMALLSGRLAGIWDQVKKANWWLAALGVSADGGKSLDIAKHAALLARLIEELEEDVAARAAQTDRKRLAEQSVADLRTFLQNHPKAWAIAALLEEPSDVKKETVEEAYGQVKYFLERR